MQWQSVSVAGREREKRERKREESRVAAVALIIPTSVSTFDLLVTNACTYF